MVASGHSSLPARSSKPGGFSSLGKIMSGFLLGCAMVFTSGVEAQTMTVPSERILATSHDGSIKLTDIECGAAMFLGDGQMIPLPFVPQQFMLMRNGRMIASGCFIGKDGGIWMSMGDIRSPTFTLPAKRFKFKPGYEMVPRG